MLARASFSDAFADRTWAGRVERSYTDRDIESDWSEMRCRRYLGGASPDASCIRSDRYWCNCFARVVLPDVGKPARITSYFKVSTHIVALSRHNILAWLLISGNFARMGTIVVVKTVPM